MKNTFGILLFGTSMTIGLGAIATTPATAASITGVTIGGTAPSDYFVYDANSQNSFKIDSILANVPKVLDGNAASPTGNVELAASSETLGFNFNNTTTLTGTIGGKNLTLSSLTASDWSSAYQGTTFGAYWFNQALAANSVSLNLIEKTALFTIFQNYGGFQRFSDPNISYVNQNDSTGLISIGLAGHYNATPLLLQSVDAYLSDPNVILQNKLLVGGVKSLIQNKTIQASEIVKYTYNGVNAGYLFGFAATASGLVELSDNVSHSGNYEVTIKGLPSQNVTPQGVPEPATIFGSLMAAVFGLAMKRKAKPVAEN